MRKRYTNPEPITDWRGTPIEPGTRIVYPVRYSSVMWMVEAEVLEIVWLPHEWKEGEMQPVIRAEKQFTSDEHRTRPARLVTIDRLDRITVVGRRP